MRTGRSRQRKPTIAKRFPPTPSRPWQRSIWAWLEDLEKVGEAIEAYERALRFEPDTASAHYNLSRLYEKKGLGKEALRHLADYRRLV